MSSVRAALAARAARRRAACRPTPDYCENCGSWFDLDQWPQHHHEGEHQIIKGGHPPYVPPPSFVERLRRVWERS